MDNKRSELYPNIPTFIDQGYDVVYATWRSIALPKGVDPVIKKMLEDAFTAAMQDPVFIA
jgi:tripartite-type tricarboxylate transporter receptor subunit TctC